MADIGMGWFVATATGTPVARWPWFALLLLASSCFYLAGMVLNDVADVDVDRRERPFRPIPSGRISRRSALWLGLALLGVGLAISCSVRVEGAVSSWLGLGLFAAVALYNSVMKGPWQRLVLMPTCRFLNVLLGLSAATAEGLPWGARCYLAATVAVYILGITLFSRNEAGASNPALLWSAAWIILLAVPMAVATPVFFDGAQPAAWYLYLLVLLVFRVGIMVYEAIQNPSPARVQKAVRTALQGLILLDTALAASVAGNQAILLLLLLLPNWYFGRWLSST